ncbi:MAG: lysoplasmalogenase [Promethearchaeota archaeon]
MTSSTFFMIGFLTLFLVHLFGELLIIKNKENKNRMLIRYITKPLLMPLLACFYIFDNLSLDWWVILGIAGGFIGDVCLMIPDPNKTKRFFKIGLISFLLGHLFYIIALILMTDFAKYEFWSISLMIPYIAIGIIVYPRLIKHTGKMKIPVTVYLIVIILMGVSTTFLWGSSEPIGIILLMMGALVFIVSDTINAFNKFAKEIPYERLYTMTTYLVGQFLLVLGFLYAT